MVSASQEVFCLMVASSGGRKDCTENKISKINILTLCARRLFATGICCPASVTSGMTLLDRIACIPWMSEGPRHLDLFARYQGGMDRSVVHYSCPDCPLSINPNKLSVVIIYSCSHDHRDRSDGKTRRKTLKKKQHWN